MTALLAPTYFGPVQWYQKLFRYPRVVIDVCDSYQKQTYRNRCLIAAANGVQALTVPVQSQRSDGGLPSAASPYVSSHGHWQHQHWQALQSAYGDSPFFEYYEDDLRPFFTETDRWPLLYDFDEAIRRKLCELLDIQPCVVPPPIPTPLSSGKERLSAALSPEGSAPFHDFRSAIHPKHAAPDADFQPRRYYQVYEQKHGFLPNLSILDLLFNMGPESVFYL